MDPIRAIILVYLCGFALTVVLLLWRNREVVRRLTPHERAMIRATLIKNPYRISDTDLINAGAVWPLVLLVLTHDWVTGRFRGAPSRRTRP